MPHYCDSAILEHHWFHWLVSSRVPILEEFRKTDLLWTKLVGDVCVNGKPVTKHGHSVKDPSHPVRLHCIATAEPIFFTTVNGELQGSILIDGKEASIHDIINELTLDSDSSIHKLDTNPFSQIDVKQKLMDDGYFKELPTQVSWNHMTIDINNICNGIATKFKQKSDEEKTELSHETFIQVIQKITRYKLVYVPGVAPVFNLLTTTIYRCMCSIMNRRKSQREGLHKFIKDAKNGAIKSSNRSLRMHNITR